MEKSINEEIKELEKKLGDVCNDPCLDANLTGQIQALESATKKFEDVLNEIDFTNLLRQQDCINVNFVMDKIKEEIKSRLGVAG